MNWPRLDWSDPLSRPGAAARRRTGPAGRTTSRARSRTRRYCSATLADDDPSIVDLEPARGDAPAGVDPPHDAADIVRRPRPSPGRRCRRRRRRSGPGSRSAESIQRLTGAAAVVGVAVGAEADVDRDRELLASATLQQVVDRVSDARGVVERRAPLLSRPPAARSGPRRSSPSGDPRLPAAMLATWVPCEPWVISDCGSRSQASTPAAAAPAIAASRCSLRSSDP